MNRRGQALIEFVLILPVFLMILFAIVDFGNYLFSRNELENTSTDITRLLLSDHSLSEISLEYPDVDIEFDSYKDKYRKLVVSRDIKVITPFLDKVLGNPCVVSVERIVPNVE